MTTVGTLTNNNNIANSLWLIVVVLPVRTTAKRQRRDNIDKNYTHYYFLQNAVNLSKVSQNRLGQRRRHSNNYNRYARAYIRNTSIALDLCPIHGDVSAVK